MLTTKNIHVSELINYVGSHIIKNIISINDEWCTILMKENLPYNIIKQLNLTLETEFKYYQHTVNNNVAIAAAITSYSRIHMINFKLNNDIIYSDTDSVILGNSIDDSFTYFWGCLYKYFKIFVPSCLDFRDMQSKQVKSVRQELDRCSGSHLESIVNLRNHWFKA